MEFSGKSFYYLAAHFHNDTRNKVDTILARYKLDAALCMGIAQSDTEFFSPLQHAARSGDVGVIAALLASDSESVNATSSSTHYLTALHLAAHHGGVKAVKLLVQHGANVNALDVHRHQPLHHAAKSRSNTIVKFLLKNGAKCTSGEYGWTPLLIAATLGPKAVVETLLTHSSDSINATCAAGFTPLFRAVIYREQEIAEVLLKHGSTVNILNTKYSETYSPLSIAVLGNNVEMVKILIPYVKKSPGVEHHVTMASVAFNAALLCDWKEMVKILLDSDIFSLFNYTVLKTSMNVAAAHGCAKAVEMLLEHGVDVDSEAANPTTNVGTALHVAIEKGHIEVVKVLLNHKASLNCRDSFRRTPLEVAVARNRLDIVQLLVPKGKTLVDYRRPRHVCSFLHLAVGRGYLDMVKYFVDLGCDIQEKTPGMGMRPIHVAAYEGKIDIMEYLLSKGCTIGDKSHMGKTPLYFARLQKQTAMINFLVSKGALTTTEREAAKLVNDLGVPKDTTVTTPIKPAQAKKSKKYLEVVALKNDMVNEKAVPAIKVAPAVRDTDSKERRDNASKRRKRKNKLSPCEKSEKRGEEVRQKEEDVTVPEPAGCSSKVEPVGLEINGEFYRQKDFHKIRDTPNGIELAKAAMLSAINANDSQSLRKVVKEFISRKNLPYVVNSKSPSCGSTALHFAAQSGVLELVKRLLHSGAIFNITNNDGLTPVNVANGQQIIDYLQSIEQSYVDAKNGNYDVLDRLKELSDIDLRVIAGTTNVEGDTIARVANVAGFRDLRIKFMYLFNVVDNY